MTQAAAAVERGARRRHQTRRALLDAARQVIGERGVDATTIGEITERADVAFGSFYNHFESKDALVDDLIAEAVVAHRDYVDAVNLRFAQPAEMDRMFARLDLDQDGSLSLAEYFPDPTARP